MKLPQRTEAERIAGTLFELAQRCEAASGPDRHLDALISGAMIRDITATHFRTIEAWAAAAIKEHWNFAAYTRSFDAAIALVPSGWGWNVSNPNERAIASGLLKERTPVRGEVEYGFDQRYIVAAATPALALCAAALCARAHLLSQEQTDER